MTPAGVVVMGLDPGLANLGFGIVRSDGMQSELVDYGAITTQADELMPRRLRELFDATTELSRKHRPAFVAVETLYFARNTKTAIQVAQARGAVLAALARDDAHVLDMTPLQVKLALTGYGRADKRQIQMMIRTILGLEDIPRPDHAADALALAIACAHTLRRRR